MLSYIYMKYTKNNNLDTNREDIIEAVDSILKPIANTMSPQGSNVIFRGNNGKIISTNDGATIAKVISPKSELQKIIVDIIVEASENTNKLEGDATSTTILLTGTLIKHYIEYSDSYGSPYEFIKQLRESRNYILENLKNQKIEPTEGLLKKLAFISANNDSSIADVAYDVATKAGEYGIVGYNMENSNTEYSFDEGYIVHDAIPHPMFVNNKPKEVFSNVGIFATTMQMFHQEHLDTILKEYKEVGYKTVLIISPSFQAKVPDMISEIVNNKELGLHIVPIEIEDENIIGDIAAYSGVHLYTKGLGTPTPDKIKRHIGSVDLVTATMSFIVIKKNNNENNEKLKQRVTLLQSYLNEGKDKDKTKMRLASLTTGIVTLSPGGSTDVERVERQLRFDDAIRAVHRATSFGCLPGGGVALKDIYTEFANMNPDDIKQKIIESVCLANIRQIMHNCGEGNVVYLEKGFGFNALTGVNGIKMVDAGIVDSYSAVEQALRNSFSTAEQLVSAINNNIITHEHE